MASTTYNGYRYCTTLEQIQNADIYVIDVPGVVTLLENYDKIDRLIYVIYFDANICNRIRRMLQRHDSDTQIVGRLLQDEESDWFEDLLSIESHHYNKMGVYHIDANLDLNDVYSEVKNLINDLKNFMNWKISSNLSD